MPWSAVTDWQRAKIRHNYHCAYPYELDEYEDSDTATNRHLAAPMLSSALHATALPNGDRIRLPIDWVMFGDTAKWHKRSGASTATARVLDLDGQDQPSLDDSGDQ